MLSLRGRALFRRAATMAQSGSISTDARERLRRTRGICFDMDGTLTVPALDFAKMRSLCGVPLGQPILETVLQYPEPRRSQAMEYIKQVEKEGRENLQLMPGTRELLSWLLDHHVPCSLLTRNDQDAVDHFIEHLRLPSNPVKVAVTRDFLPAKPDPAPLLHIAQTAEFGMSPKEMLMVGDHTDDIECGRRAGALTCMMEQHTNVDHRHHADFSVESPLELLAVLKSVWAPE